ncbi:phiSA1p31-related protein [Streptomyces canus]|uniref:phiSA1p31-related protein n=1 Tax=Streptomyces canus TaxID=58343 RepID=UPI0037F9E1E6
MTTILDGMLVDLDRVQVAVDGSHWLWMCEHGDSGQPLMLRVDTSGQRVWPLDYVVRRHGALAPERTATTAAMYRRVLEVA